MRSSIHDRPAFIVGVTGLMEIHPDDIAAVRSAVQTIFDWIRYSPQAGEKGDQILGKGLGLPDSTPVVLLSSLAPGADQMVAATAVTRNFCVRAPLPFPIQLYPEASTFRRGHKDSSGNPIVDATGLPVPTAEDLARQQQLADSLKPITSQNTFHVLLADDLNRTEPDLDRILQADLRDKHRRNLRYRAAGEYVAAYSDLLIAICDQAGENDAPIGNSNLSALEQSGARHILQVRRRGLTPGLLSVQSAISWADNGPIIRIYARRAPNYSSPPTTVPPTVDIKAGDIALWYPLDSRPHSFSPEAWNEKQMEVFREFVKRLAEMNDQLNACAPVDLQKSLNKLLPEFSNPYRPLATLEKVTNWCKKFLPSQGNDTGPNDIPPKQMCCSPKLERLALFRAQVTDRNRNFYDKKIKKLARSFFILALTAIFLVQLAEYWVPKVASGAPAPVWLNPLQIMAFLTAIIVISVAWWLNAGKKRSRLDDWQNDSRALGESLRVQFYWTASGTGQSVASNFLQRARGEASWLRSAVSSLAFPYEEDRRDFRNLSPDEQLDRLRRVKLGWVQEQLNFFERRVHEFQMRKGSLHFWANLLLAAGSGLVILNFFANPNRFEQTIEDACRWLGLWGFIAWGVLMLLGWLICHFVHLKAWQRHRSKVVQNFQPDPEESSHVAYERWIHISHLVHRVLEDWRVAVFLGFLLSACIAGVIYDIYDVISPAAATNQPISSHTWIAEPEKLMSITKNILLALGGLLHWWAAAKFLGENIRRYSAMAGLFRGAADRTDSLLASLTDQIKQTNQVQAASPSNNTGLDTDMEKTIAAIQEVYVALGREALNENADWLLMHRNKPIEPLSPAG